MSSMKGRSSITGGHLIDIPRPHKRKFPNKNEKREITINIIKFYGVGQHYYATVKQEDNAIICNCGSIVNEHEHYPWDDLRGKGKCLTKRFNTEKEAKDWINHTVNAKFNLNTHKVLDSFKATPPKWFYKDGD